MKANLISLYFLIGIYLSFIPQLSHSQQPKNFSLEASASADLGLYDAESLLGFGIHFKLLRDLSKNNNAFVGGVDLDILNYTDIYSNSGIYSTVLVASLGYRKRIKSFFIEPQIGGGLYKEENYNAPCIFLGLEPGLQRKRLSYSINYRFISTDGFIDGDHFHMFAFRVGYKIGVNKNR